MRMITQELFPTPWKMHHKIGKHVKQFIVWRVFLLFIKRFKKKQLLNLAN